MYRPVKPSPSGQGTCSSPPDASSAPSQPLPPAASTLPTLWPLSLEWGSFSPLCFLSGCSLSMLNVLNSCNIVTISIFMVVSTNSNICVSFDWLTLLLRMGPVFLLLCNPVTFLLDARHFELCSDAVSGTKFVPFRSCFWSLLRKALAVLTLGAFIFHYWGKPIEYSPAWPVRPEVFRSAWWD